MTRNRASVVFVEAKRTVRTTGAVETLHATGFIVSEDGYVFMSRVLLGKESDADDIKFMGALQSQFAPPQPLQYIDQSDLGDVLVLKLSNTSVKWQHIELGEPFEVELALGHFENGSDASRHSDSRLPTFSPLLRPQSIHRFDPRRPPRR